jgi:ABC transporter DrrB family efflux protein
MSIRRTLATTERVLKQLRHDPRTVAMIMLIPIVLVTIIKYVFDGNPRLFNNIAPIMLGIFPLIIMFLVTSIATLRERTSGTLDRLMTQPISKLDIVLGYAIAFSLLGFIQACIVSWVTVTFLDVTIEGSVISLLVTATAAAFLGTSLGLFISAFARNEFQAVQLVMPMIMPQVLICGLFISRDQMSEFLQRIADILPLTYSVDAMKQVASVSDWSSTLTYDLLIVVSFGIVVLLLGALTIRRRE